MTKIYGIYEKNGQCVTVGTVKEIVRYLKSEGASARAICYAMKKGKTNKYTIKYLYNEREAKDDKSRKI